MRQEFPEGQKAPDKRCAGPGHGEGVENFWWLLKREACTLTSPFKSSRGCCAAGAAGGGRGNGLAKWERWRNRDWSGCWRRRKVEMNARPETCARWPWGEGRGGVALGGLKSGSRAEQGKAGLRLGGLEGPEDLVTQGHSSRAPRPSLSLTTTLTFT